MDELAVDDCVLPLEASPAEELARESSEAEDAAVPHTARGPHEPSDMERKRHEATHLSFRSWCRHCVMGRMSNPRT